MAENRDTASANCKPWGHKWGFSDTRFVLEEDGSVTLEGDRYHLAGYRMYDLIPYAESVLELRLDLDNPQREVQEKPVPPPRCNPGFCEAVQQAFPAEQITQEDGRRLLHSHGQTTADEVYRVLYDKLDRVVDMVFTCRSEEDARRIIELARAHRVCLVPYGGGTSVSSALKLTRNEERMVVSVDMRGMNQVEWIDKENLRACVQAGITGMELERRLAAEGFTCGHEPDSIELSTLGGWISTNASGMKKNRYGNIEQIVEKITMITPQGELDQVEALPRASIGSQPQQLLFGSEGNLGLITKAVIKIHPLPEVKKYGSLLFPNFRLGTEFLYRLAHTAYLPASIRLVDNAQFRFGQALKPRVNGVSAWKKQLEKFYVLRVKGFDPEEMVAATIVMEGTREEVAFQEKNVYALAKKFQGMPAGAENGRRGYMLTYAIAYIRDFLADFHVIGETFETSVPWSRIEEVCRAVKEEAARLHEASGFPGRCYVSYRVTQTYHTGVCIYFMYAACTRGVERPHEVFAGVEHALRHTIIEHGGSVSHHHGVGKIRKDFMKDTLSPASIELLGKIKEASDPENVFGIGNNVLGD